MYSEASGRYHRRGGLVLWCPGGGGAAFREKERWLFLWKTTIGKNPLKWFSWVLIVLSMFFLCEDAYSNHVVFSCFWFNML